MIYKELNQMGIPKCAEMTVGLSLADARLTRLLRIEVERRMRDLEFWWGDRMVVLIGLLSEILVPDTTLRSGELQAGLIQKVEAACFATTNVHNPQLMQGQFLQVCNKPENSEYLQLLPIGLTFFQTFTLLLLRGIFKRTRRASSNQHC
jgi:hypothetical protein